EAILREAVERRVLAEVFHPAVVAVGDGFREELRVVLATHRMREVELPHPKHGGAGVVVDEGAARRVAGERARSSRLVEARRIGLADHGVEVRGDGDAASMQRGGARWLPSGVAALIPAGKVVPIRLRYRDGSVGSAELLDLRGLAREVAAGLKPG